MALVPLLNQSDVDPADAEALAAGERGYGKLLHTWRGIINRPGLFAAYLPFLRTVAGPGALDQRTKELSAVRVGVLNHCRYTTSHRCASAQAEGVSAADLESVARGDFAAFTESERVALELTDAMTLAPAQTPYGVEPSAVEPALRERAAALFPPGALVELTMSISVWNALARFHRVMGFELDMDPPPPGVDAVL
jgi:AhpD family alkylhydroperoxidase